MIEQDRTGQDMARYDRIWQDRKGQEGEGMKKGREGQEEQVLHRLQL